MKYRKLIAPYLISNGRKFRLAQIRPDDGARQELKKRIDELMAGSVARLSELQEKLYAQNTWGMLIIFQAMDAAGKDSTIKHVLSGVNPQGCEVFSFKQPSAEELNHDFLWRAAQRLPERGRIGIFNRSYYEETLVVRVHRELLDKQKLPDGLTGPGIWQERFEDIRSFERYLTRNGISLLKIFLHVSKDEQQRRFLKRLDKPEKNWKFSTADLEERKFWKDYMDAYEEMIRHTATPHAPWLVVPADHKWFAQLVVAAAIIEKLDSLKLSFPRMTAEQKDQLKKARTRLA
ncbi:MAG: polyphosphate kinase 2 family protein [Candidatus Omnitrophica bacterium]|nr:polyphosphate kinase 2 family protein [Candidatus Omnitrophota bacterium]